MQSLGPRRPSRSLDRSLAGAPRRATLRLGTTRLMGYTTEGAEPHVWEVGGRSPCCEGTQLPRIESLGLVEAPSVLTSSAVPVSRRRLRAIVLRGETDKEHAQAQ